MKSVAKTYIEGKQEKIPICPKCDAYALGIKLVKGFPFKTKHGRNLTIHDMEDILQ